MSIKSNLQKGKDLENFVAGLLNSSGIDSQAIRQIGSGNGKRKGDIHTSIDWTFECKNTARFDWGEASKQVAREAMGYGKEVIIWHPPKTPLDSSVAIINIHDFIDLLKTAQAPKIKSDDREMKYKLTALREADRRVLNELG